MFDGKIIVITGGSSGLGKQLATRLVARGAKVALVARDKAKLDSVRDELASAVGDSEKVMGFPCDVSDYQSVERMVAGVVESFGMIDMLINSAGILREGYFEAHKLETFRQVMDINYFGTLHCARAVLPVFKKNGKGHMVNICSMGGLAGGFGYAAYCSSKFAVHGLTEVLRMELKPQNVKVQIVCPPEFDSPMVEAIEADNRTAENRYIAHTLPVMGLDAVADETMKGIEKGKYMIIPGLATRLMEVSNRLAPFMGRALVDIRLKKVYRGPSS